MQPAVLLATAVQIALLCTPAPAQDMPKAGDLPAPPSGLEPAPPLIASDGKPAPWLEVQFITRGEPMALAE